jgi:hypothetical protein
MTVEPDYRGFRIEVTAHQAEGVWNADVRIRSTSTDMKPHVERMTCRKATAKVAEERGAVYARRWIDRQSDAAAS